MMTTFHADLHDTLLFILVRRKLRVATVQWRVRLAPYTGKTNEKGPRIKDQANLQKEQCGNSGPMASPPQRLLYHRHGRRIPPGPTPPSPVN